MENTNNRTQVTVIDGDRRVTFSTGMSSREVEDAINRFEQLKTSKAESQQHSDIQEKRKASIGELLRDMFACDLNALFRNRKMSTRTIAAALGVSCQGVSRNLTKKQWVRIYEHNAEVKINKLAKK